jgi:hypothetical protein
LSRKFNPSKPLSERRVLEWVHWPQALAPSVTVGMEKHKGSGAGFVSAIGMAGQALSARFDPPLPTDRIVVFYPKRKAAVVKRSIRYRRHATRKGGGLTDLKGLSICATRRLQGVCMAFRIEDVEAHRTPADCYYVKVESPGRSAKKLNPEPLYAEAESNLGTEIHE